jgi:AcrR family transcriptional regulator
MGRVAQMPHLFATGWNEPTSSDPTEAKILDAALGLFAEVGIRRTSIDDIAKRAGVNRATLYRRVGAKEQIVRAAMLRETSRVLGDIVGQLQLLTDEEQRITVGFAVTVTALRTNPILQKALAVDVEETLAAITVDAADVVSLATAFVSDQIVTTRGRHATHQDAEELAGIIVRLVHSLVLTPDAPPRLRTDAELRAFAARHLVPLISTTPT